MSRQAEFASALLKPEHPCPSGLKVPLGVDPEQRFAVHRNNVLSSLVDALAENFPIVRQLVGAAFFNAMAVAFVTAATPRSPLLSTYGEGFAGFIESFGPARDVPYLPDMARLELARIRSYHAADAQPLATEVLAARLASPEQLVALCLQLHPSVQVITSNYAVVSLWAAHNGRGALAQCNPYQPEQGVLLRSAWEVFLLPVSLGAAHCIDQLGQGQPLSLAAAAGLQHDEHFDMAGTLAMLLQNAAITGCSVLTN